jgi:hypothetical protein
MNLFHFFLQSIELDSHNIDFDFGQTKVKFQYNT